MTHSWRMCILLLLSWKSIDTAAVIDQPVLLTPSLVLLLLREDSLEKYRHHFSPSLTSERMKWSRQTAALVSANVCLGQETLVTGNLVMGKLSVDSVQSSHHERSQWWRCHMETSGCVGQFWGGAKKKKCLRSRTLTFDFHLWELLFLMLTGCKEFKH